MRTRLTTLTKLGVAALTLIAGPAFAHHSGAMFDPTRPIDLKGTIKVFQWTNPHSWIQIEVPNAQGKVEEWAVESGSPNSLARQGWRPGTFKPGDRVTIRVGPMKDGSKGGIFVGAMLADGRTLGRMGEAPRAN